MNRQLSKINLPINAKPGFEASLLDSLRKQDNDIISQINSQVQGVGAILPSGPAVTPTNAIHHVSGSAPVATIVPSAGFTGDLTLIADAGFTTVTGGNIATAITAPAGHAIKFVFDNNLWYPLVSA